MAIEPRFALALEYVPDVEAAKRFYVDVFGLEVERDHPTFVQFKSDSGAAFAIASDAAMTPGAELELYWVVDDAQAAFAELSRTAEIGKSLTQEAFGTVFGVIDPAGQPRYLLEFARERPSRQVR
ncbi:MAG TPA: VOC family protein [Thermomicrobiales bacterium]|nr:VOC family protein [Thermomicrobiales bacterium]